MAEPEKKAEPEAAKPEPRRKRVYDHPSSKKARGDGKPAKPEKDARADETGKASSSGSADAATPGEGAAAAMLPDTHKADHKDMHGRHEKERRDLHGLHRDEHRTMHGRHVTELGVARDLGALTERHRAHETEHAEINDRHAKSMMDLYARQRTERAATHERHEKALVASTPNAAASPSGSKEIP